ncbi:MAG: glycosyltransferase [Alphaproteobacteria bacterium]|nr:glycosyltransferase [Alphaproteobacteria bacterium]
MTIPPRRRILYIRHRRSLEISDGFRMNQDEWVETLSALADVALQDEDFDLDEACDRFRPDFILYESPALYPVSLTIKNPAAHPQIPRIAFQMQDPYCATRVNFLRVIEALNIRWIFTHMPEIALRQSPELKARTFSVSHLFDDAVFYDYGLEKDIPVSAFGGFLAPEIYAWRAETLRVIAERFPTLIYTHPGYRAPVPRHKFAVSGAAFARLLNRSHFSLADTSRFDCLVRKHLEIPASGSVLVAPDTPSLKPYGFRDMENCILGAGDALFDKMAAVADDPDLYEKIRKSGYDLVHCRYSRKHWRGILDFYECLRILKPGETIRQQGLFGAFEIVPDDDRCSPAIIADYPDSEVSILAKAWLQNILAGTGLDEIEAKMTELSRWLTAMTEYWVPMGIVSMLKGDLVHAREFFLTPQRVRKEESGFTEYDPEEIAWLSLTAALSGDADLMKLTRKESASLRHLSLRRVQWLGAVLASKGDASNPPQNVLRRAKDDHLSIHWTGQLEMEDWLGLTGLILKANGQEDAAAKLPNGKNQDFR